MNCPLQKIEVNCANCDYAKQSLCDYPYERGMVMAKIKITTENMITWKFKCLKCGYRFKAVEPKKLYEIYTKCAMCGSKKFEKEVINEAGNL